MHSIRTICVAAAQRMTSGCATIPTRALPLSDGSTLSRTSGPGEQRETTPPLAKTIISASKGIEALRCTEDLHPPACMLLHECYDHPTSKEGERAMRVTVRELNRNISGVLHDATEAGEPATIVNARRSGQPTEAMLVSAELWESLLRLPGAKKRVREHVAAKQAEGEGELPEVAFSTRTEC